MSLVKRVVVALVALCLIAVGVIAAFISSTIPDYNQSARFDGVQNSVSILRNEQAVPYVLAQTEEDLFFAQGYLHAQDRLFQMDFFRRLAYGRLSEIAGAKTVKTDRFFRVFQVNKWSTADYQSMSPDSRRLLGAYTRGVNSFIESGAPSLPVEFYVLRCDPEEWRPEDSLAIIRLMGLGLSFYAQELFNANVFSQLGPEILGRLMPDIKPTSYGMTDVRLSDLLSDPGLLDMFQQSSAFPPGSNTWVVSGRITASGKPLLANDPHLSLIAPAYFYQMYLEAGRYRVGGMSLPGFPGIMAGHNDRIAWGLTAFPGDVMDLYLEKTNSEDSDRYYRDRGWQQFERVPVEIQIKGDEPLLETMEFSDLGPILPELSSEEYRISVDWTGFNAFPAVDCILELNLARNWEEFHRALRNLGVPVLNVSYADVDGNIGLKVAGALPIRSGSTGTVPVPAWDAASRWMGRIPFEETPEEYNPDRGYIANANNNNLPPEFNYPLGNMWFPPYRVNRICQQIGMYQVHDVGSFKKMQMDTYAHPMQSMLGIYLDAVQASGDFDAVEDVFKTSHLTPTTATVPVGFYAWYRELFRLIFLPVLGDSLYESTNAFTQIRLGQTLNDVLTGQSSSHETFNLDQESMTRLAREAHRLAERTLRQKYGDRRSELTWGDIHQVKARHPLGQIPLFGRFFNIGPAPAPGSLGTINVAPFDLNKFPYLVTYGPQFRAIYDLSNWSNNEYVLSTGQSGNAFSQHYDDQFPGWIAGEYHRGGFKGADDEWKYRCFLWPAD